MCGIVGIYNLKSELDSKNQRSRIKAMADTITHRGPDDEGYYIDETVSLGHRRLSIVDLSCHGHQPMIYDDGNLAIVFNGEVYNYIEIRQELEKKNYKFSSKTDTEVILAAYKEWGTDCLNKFNGMWAFTIYDKKRKLLFGARDRLGVKPFYYSKNLQSFIFASEIKAILANPEIKAQPNDPMIWDFVMLGLTGHTEETLFKGIKELEGGKYFVLDKKQFVIRKYWDLKQAKKLPPMSNKEYAAKFKELFLDSVKLRLRSDVPIGTCLSGGLDSSAIVCVINNFLKMENIEQIGKIQQTFSACYENKKYPNCDERKFIKEVINKTEAKSYYTFPDGDKLIKEIENVVWHQDLPFYSTSIYAQWNVYRLASKKKIKVMLDGQGSDELLAGYHHYFGLYFAELIKEAKFFKLIKESISYNRNHKKSLFDVFKNLIFSLIKSGKGGFLLKLYRNNTPEYDLFKSNWRNKYSHSMVLSPSKNIFVNGLYTQTVKSSLPTLLRFEDRNSMAFSIESRVPFLDYRLAEFIYALPDDQKISEGQTKWIMREALKGILPEKIRKRQDKIGFATPEEIWMKKNFHKEFKKIFQSNLFLSRGYFEKDKATKIFDDFLQGKIKNYSLFWRLYCLEIWFRIFIDKKSL